MRFIPERRDWGTKGTVISVKTQWWLKVNTKAVRFGPLDGATFPHIVKVKYTVDGTDIKIPVNGYVKLDSEGNIVNTWEGVQ